MERAKRPRARRTTNVVVCCSGVLGGLICGRLEYGLTIVLGTLLALAALFVAKQYWRTVAVVGMCALALGYWRGYTCSELVNRYQAYYGQPVTVVGYAVEDAVYADGSQLEVRINQIRLLRDGQAVQLPGAMRIRGYGAAAIGQGDEVRATAKLYPARSSNVASMSFAELVVSPRAPAWYVSARREILAGLQAALPEPQASFAAGLLLGQRSGLPDDVTTSLQRVGLTHIIAVSGYNLTILVLIVRRIMRRRSKFQTAAAAVLLMFVFLLLTGGSASIVRASIVSSLALACWYYGRPIRPIILLLLPAAATAYWSPLYIWRDVGWYLSFLAFFGVLIVAPLLRGRFFGSGEPKVLAATLLETVCAQVMTMPFVLFVFGEVSSVALFSNLLVVPFVPLAMLLSALAGVFGVFVPMIAGWFAWPARWLLRYMLDISLVLSRPRWSLLQWRFTDIGLVIAYCGVLVLIGVLWHRTRQKTEVMI